MKIKDQIVKFLLEYAKTAKIDGFVVGVSGGVDSAVVSTLCAETGLPTSVISIPIKQQTSELDRADIHMTWLNKYPNVVSYTVSMGLYSDDSIFDQFCKHLLSMFRTYPENWTDEAFDQYKLTESNTKSRFRMIILYFYAGLNKYLVVGTGNKIEDYGVGFFTKYGDGGVDLSPIGDLTKTEVRTLAKDLGINDDIIIAKPTDGLWEDGRTDEEQLGATYEELEWAMKYIENNPKGFAYSPEDLIKLNERERIVLHIYKSKHFANEHKILPIPICKIKKQESDI